MYQRMGVIKWTLIKGLKPAPFFYHLGRDISAETIFGFILLEKLYYYIVLLDSRAGVLSAAGVIGETIVGSAVLTVFTFLQDGAAFQYLAIGRCLPLEHSGRHPSRLPGSSAQPLTGYFITTLRDHIDLANVAGHIMFDLVEQA